MALEDILKGYEVTKDIGNAAEKTGNQVEKAGGQVQDFKDLFNDDDDFDINATVTVDTSQAQQAVDDIPKELETKVTVDTSQAEQSADDIIKKLEEVKKTAVDTF